MKAVVEMIGGWRATIFLAIGIAAGAFAWLQTTRLAFANLVIAEGAKLTAEARAGAEADARKAEQNMARAVAVTAATEFERGKQYAQQKADVVVNGLRDGTLRLRREWAACETSKLASDSAAVREFGAAEQRRIESAARIIRAVAECDAQTNALIAAYNSVRDIVSKGQN